MLRNKIFVKKLSEIKIDGEFFFPLAHLSTENEEGKQFKNELLSVGITEYFVQFAFFFD